MFHHLPGDADQDEIEIVKRDVYEQVQTFINMICFQNYLKKESVAQ